MQVQAALQHPYWRLEAELLLKTCGPVFPSDTHRIDLFYMLSDLQSHLDWPRF